MGIFLSVLALLVIAALVCGVFFLIFKLIWLLFGNHSNKAPLWLAAGVTLLLAGMAVMSVYSTYNTFAKPIVTMAQNIEKKTTVTKGTRLYKNDQFGYAFTALGGMEFSDWINYQGFHMQVAVDANPFVATRNNKTDKQNASYSGVLTFVIDNDQEDDTDDLFEKAQDAFEQARESVSAKGTLTLNQPQKVTLAQGQPALFTEGTYKPYSNPNTPMNVFVLVTQNDKYVYVISAMAMQAKPAYLQSVKKQITSFQLI